MFFPFQDLAMLALESSRVINLRLAKIGRGGCDALTEVDLMVTEKVEALAEASLAALGGQTTSGMIDRLRFHVAANEARLSG